MVFSPAMKKKRLSNVRRTMSTMASGAVCEVEEILGFKLYGHAEIRFLIKWKNFEASHNSWEPFENLVHCSVFREYVDEKYASFEKDIYINLSNIRQKLKKRFRQALGQVKAITLHEVFPFDPFEFKIRQVFYHMLPHNDHFQKVLDELVFKHYFFKMDMIQRKKHDELLIKIRKKEDFKVVMENEVDFEDPPEFTYITKNLFSDEIYMVEHNAIKGCTCKTCTNDVECCPKLMREQFVYKLDTHGRSVPRFTIPVKIFECGDLCECGFECMNRVTQQTKTVPLCLFKTEGRGWGIKALSPIHKGAFILEYVGEIIGQTEANSRAETAYLFDLNPDGKKQGFYTIDAFKYGNLSRFINHSCEPNAIIWFVNTCDGRPENQKLW